MKVEKYFTVLPYIQIENDFSFGEFDIWIDTVDNWKKYLGTSRPASLLNIYVNHKGKRIIYKTIITSKKKFNSTRLQQLISFLFFIPSQRHFIRFTAESFYYETYTHNAKKGMRASHTRIDKFVRSLVMSREFKIFQTHEADISRLELRNQFEVKDFEKLKLIFTNSRKKYISKCLPFYLRTQFRNLLLFPDLEDIQNFCTAFEIFFKVDVMAGTGDLIAKKLFRLFSLADSPERTALKDWFVELYQIRSHYTHGKDVPDSKLIYKHQRHIDIARQVYCECINKRLRPNSGEGRRILSNDRSLLVALFSSQEVVEETIITLTTGWGKSESGKKSLDFLLTCNKKQLGQLLALFYKLILYVKKSALGEVNKKRVLAAMQTIACMLKYLVDNYRKDEFREKYYIEALDAMKDLPFITKMESDIDTMYGFTKNPMFETNQVIGNLDNPETVKYRGGVMFRDVYDISLLNHAYTDLYEIYKGWNY